MAMKRVLRISDAAAQSELLLSNLHKHPSTPKTSTRLSFSFCFSIPKSPLRRFYGDPPPHTNHSPPPPHFPIISMCIEKLSKAEALPKHSDGLIREVSLLRDELLESADHVEEVSRVLDEKGYWLLGSYEHSCALRTQKSDDRAFLLLLKTLSASPNLAMEAFHWRRRKAEQGYPMTREEYCSGITIAGRLKNVDLAVELFVEADSKQLKQTPIYNALMGVYMYNGLAEKCQMVFRNLKRDQSARPSIVTYNILISVFGRLMLIDHMEATFQEIQNENLSPTISTYNNVIAAYLTAWMWDRMEKTFHLMEAGPVKPDIRTHLLMLRGYAHSGQLDLMEETYQRIKDHVNDKEIPLIRAMICAYCKSSLKDRIKRIEELLMLIPESEYRPWLNLLLIRVYAQEDCLERMEDLINKAFQHKTSVSTLHLMRCIIAAYYRFNAIDKLENFVKRAESAGWRICRSLYHCKMVMYGSQNRLEEMENVLNEMNNFNIMHTKKTCWILFKAYSMCGKRHKVEQVAGLMCKRGFGIPLGAHPS